MIVNVAEDVREDDILGLDGPERVPLMRTMHRWTITEEICLSGRSPQCGPLTIKD